MSVMANSTAQALNATSAESNFDTSPIPVQRPGPYFEAIVGAQQKARVLNSAIGALGSHTDIMLTTTYHLQPLHCRNCSRSARPIQLCVTDRLIEG
ncbi:glycophorin-C isoform X2 [Siphateles boraxobius]|uniref:glycophorin-C isoform X2 n=1 Tax=Siphateles boraxobius TaxID=180520 RepID=UPI0040634829